jgi:hypothetical protein
MALLQKNVAPYVVQFFGVSNGDHNAGILARARDEIEEFSSNFK